jgi:hypothetical protein
MEIYPKRHTLMRSFFYTLFFILPLLGLSQSPEEVIAKLQAKFKKVTEYSVKAQIDTRIPFIKMLPVSAQIYFKQPDVFKVQSKGIAIIPRQGFDQIGRLINNSGAFTLVPQGSVSLQGVQAQMITLIPNQDTGEVLMGKLWIDPVKIVVLKSQLTTRTNGTVSADFVYGSQIANALPDKIVFSIDTKKFKIPKALTGDMNGSTPKAPEKPTDTKGTITILLSNYVVK